MNDQEQAASQPIAPPGHWKAYRDPGKTDMQGRRGLSNHV
jgi:hypothetical protein